MMCLMQLDEWMDDESIEGHNWLCGIKSTATSATSVKSRKRLGGYQDQTAPRDSSIVASLSSAM